MISASFSNLIGTNSRDKNLVPIGYAIKIIVMKNTKKRWVQNPKGPVVIKESSGMIHRCKSIEFVSFAIIIGV
jgi:hypothetical protein